MAPDGWRTGPIRDFADINPHYDLDRGEEAPYIELASVAENFQGVRDIATREFTGSGSRFTSGDVLFARITPSAENGKVALVSSLGEGVIGWGSTEWIVLSPHDDVLPEYLFHLVCSHPVHAVATSMMEGTSGRQRVPHDVMGSIQVSVPSVSEQEAIVNVLSMAGDVIGDTRRVRDKAQSVMSGLLQDLMTEGIGHSEFQKTEVGTIPAEWKAVRLSDVLIGPGLRNGISPATTSEGNGVPTFSIGALRRGRLAVDQDTIKYADVEPDKVDGYQLRKGDVLLIRGNANPELVGRAGLADEFPEGSIYPDILIRVTLDTERILPDFFVKAWNSPKIRRQIRGVAQTTSGTLKINQRQTKRVLIPLPPIREQRQILQTIPSDLDKRYQELLGRWAILKQGVAQDLLTGRVRVPAA